MLGKHKAKRAEQNLLVQLQVFCGAFDNTNEVFIGMFIESLFCWGVNSARTKTVCEITLFSHSVVAVVVKETRKEKEKK